MEHGPLFWITVTAAIVVASMAFARCEEDCMKKRCAGGEKPELIVTRTRTYCVCGAFDAD